MNELYIDCSMGTAGDMLSGALYDLLPESGKEQMIRALSDNLKGRAEVFFEQSRKSGIAGIHFHVLVNGVEEGHQDIRSETEHPVSDHHHSETDCPVSETHQPEPEVRTSETHHRHHDHHEHHSLADILSVIDGFTFPDDVKDDIREVYQLIAKAESKVHGRSVGEIHFHEVGAMDAVADISAVCYALHLLHPDHVTVSPVSTGYGTVRCAHGILPVPAPATAELLKDIPARTGDVEGELCTPTGAALIRHFADSYGRRPDMTINGIGRGVGTKDFSRPNILQVFTGTSSDTFSKASAAASRIQETLPLEQNLHGNASENRPEVDSQKEKSTDTITELSCNIDDMTGEEIGFALEELLRHGALDAWTTPIQMKKSRPAVLLTVLCRPEDEPAVVRSIFRCTTTLGIRKSQKERYILERETETIETPDGPVRKKTSRGYGVTRSKYEYEDLARIARETGRSIREARESL